MKAIIKKRAEIYDLRDSMNVNREFLKAVANAKPFEVDERISELAFNLYNSIIDFQCNLTCLATNFK